MFARHILTALFGAILVFGAANVAQAQATRTWVSGVGDDANPCSRTAPCKTFAGAISKTAPAGEINVIDPGGFGAVTITKPIAIRAGNIQSGVLVSGTNAIIVNNLLGGDVILEGLDIEGLGTGLNGVHILAGGSIYIIRSSIHNFATNGVNMSSSTPGARLFIKDTMITRNGTNGTANTGGVNIPDNGKANVVSISNSVIDSNQNYAIQIAGATNTVALANSILNASPAALAISGGAKAVSFGPSNIVSGAGAFTQTNPFK